MSDDDEKRIEYQQVAALVCQDIEVLADIAKNETSLESLKKQIAWVHKLMLEAQTNKEARQRRYAAGCLVFGINARRTR